MADLIKIEVACRFDDCENTTTMYWPKDKEVYSIRCKECKPRKDERFKHNLMRDMNFNKRQKRNFNL